MLNNKFKLQSLLRLRERELESLKHQQQRLTEDINRLDQSLGQLRIQHGSALRDSHELIRWPGAVISAGEPETSATSSKFLDNARILESQRYLSQLQLRIAEIQQELRVAQTHAHEHQTCLVKTQQKVHILQRLADKQEFKLRAQQQATAQAEIDQWNNSARYAGIASLKSPRD